MSRIGWRDEVVAADAPAVRALVAATGFFTPDEISIAEELVTERLAHGPASGYHFVLADMVPDADGVWAPPSPTRTPTSANIGQHGRPRRDQERVATGEAAEPVVETARPVRPSGADVPNVASLPMVSASPPGLGGVPLVSTGSAGASPVATRAAPFGVATVARSADEAILSGYACFGPVSGTESTFDLYWIVVAPHAQRIGLGRAILARAEAAMRTMGATRHYAETSDTGLYAATRRFYRATGFRQVAHIPDFYRRGDGKIIFERVLTE